MDLHRFVLGIVLGLYIGFPRLSQLRFNARDPILTGILKVIKLPVQVGKRFDVLGSLCRAFAETPKTTKGNRLAYALHVSVRYCGAPAPSESGWSSPSIVGMSSETVG